MDGRPDREPRTQTPVAHARVGLSFLLFLGLPNEHAQAQESTEPPGFTVDLAKTGGLNLTLPGENVPYAQNDDFRNPDFVTPPPRSTMWSQEYVRMRPTGVAGKVPPHKTEASPHEDHRGTEVTTRVGRTSTVTVTIPR